MTEVSQAPRADIAPQRAVLTFDPQEYCHFLADCGWTEEQKLEFIQTLWQIIIGFVDLGFDLHPVQQVIDSATMLDADSVSVLDYPATTNF